MPTKVIGFKPTPDIESFLDSVRGDLSYGQAMKKIVVFLMQFSHTYTRDEILGRDILPTNIIKASKS